MCQCDTPTNPPTMLQQLNFPSTSAAATAAAKKPLKKPPSPSLSFSNPTFTPLSSSTSSVSLPPKPPPSPLPSSTHRFLQDHGEGDFQEKALFLDSVGIDSDSIVSREPSVVASTSLPELRLLFDYLSSLHLSASDLGRLVSICPAILSLKLREVASVCSFLIRECNVSPSDLRRILHRRPRLLISPVSSRLRPTLYFLQSIGIHDVCRHTDLLSCSVEDKFLPRIHYFENLGFSYRDSVSMFRRFPPLFCYSVKNNLEPKFNYFVVEMCRELKELRDFPQYFSFSLDNRIKPRHQICVHKGVYFPLKIMLKPCHQDFLTRLGVCVDSSLPLRDSPFWSTYTSTLDLDLDSDSIDC